MGLRQLSREENWQMSFDDRRRRALALIDRATLTDAQKESLRTLVETASLTNPPDVIIEAKIRELQASSNGNESRVYPIVPITPPRGRRMNTFMPAPSKWRQASPDFIVSPPTQSGEVEFLKPVDSDRIMDMNELEPVTVGGEPMLRKLQPTSPEQVMANLKKDIASASSLDALSVLFIDGTEYVFTDGESEDERLRGSEIKKLITDAEAKKTTDEIPNYFPELKEKVRQLLDQPGEQVRIGDTFSEVASNVFDKISAKYTQQTGGMLRDTPERRSLAEKMKSEGGSDTKILSALLATNSEVQGGEQVEIPVWQREHADLVPFLELNEINMLNDASEERRDQWIRAQKAGILYRAKQKNKSLLKSHNPTSFGITEEKQESLEDWDTFRESFPTLLAKAQTLPELYALINKVEDGFTDGEGEELRVVWTSETLNNLIYEVALGDADINDVPELFRSHVERILGNEAVGKKTISLTSLESADRETSGGSDPETTARVEVPKQSLEERLRQAKNEMLSARGEYHDAITAHQVASRLRNGSDPETAARVEIKKEIYLAALAAYTKLEIESRVAEYRQEHEGQVRWRSLSQDKIERIAGDARFENLIPRDEHGSIRDENISPEVLQQLKEAEHFSDSEITALQNQQEFPDAERSIKARVFSEQFFADHQRKVEMNIEPGARNRYEKFVGWWGSLSKGEKIAYGSIAVLSSTALSLWAFKALAIAGASVGTKMLFGAVVGGVKGIMGGAMAGASNAYSVDNAIQANTQRTIQNLPAQIESYDRALAILSTADQVRAQRQIKTVESAMQRGGAKGAALGAALAGALTWLSGSLTWLAGAGSTAESGVVTGVEATGATAESMVSAETTPTPVSDPVIPPESGVEGGSDSAEIAEVIQSFNFREPTADEIAMFRELHDSSYNPGAPIDRIKMAIIEMLNDKGVMGTSDGMRVPSPQLDQLFERVAGGKTDVEGWRKVAVTLRENYSSLDQGPGFIRTLFTRS